MTDASPAISLPPFSPAEDPARPASTQGSSPAFLAGNSEMAVRARAIDWSSTPLGDPAGWPQSLRTAVSICLQSRFPILIWWGPEMVMIYNDAYRPMLGDKHPRSMGQPGLECWAEIRDIIGPMLASVRERGESTWSEDQMLPLARFGFVEECFFTFSYSPIRDETGGIGGVFSAISETTGRVIGERRLRMLRDLSRRGEETRTTDDACADAAKTLGENPADIPFSLLYLLEADGGHARLAATTALEAGSPAAPRRIALHDQAGAMATWPLREVLEAGAAGVVTGLSAKFGRLPGGPWPEPTETALIVPIAAPGQLKPTGFLVAGLSPRLEVDADYRGFLDLIAGHIGASVANARAYEEERKRAEALAEIDRAKTAFFSNVSHEFRTPLTLMMGPLEDTLAQSSGLAEPDRERLELAHRNALRLLKLVNTLLDFSRIEAGRIEASYEPTDVAAFTAELASVFRSATERAGLKLVIDCPPLPEPVFLDREMWEKIVLNLLSNAFKFTLAGEIEVKVEADDREARLTVRDTGTGIPADEIPRLFERFHRVKGARGRSYEGSGIGLALVQELVRLHGGSVRVESEVDRGSRFIVSLPLGRAHLPAARIAAARTLASTGLRTEAFVEEVQRWLPGEDHAALATAPISATARAEFHSDSGAPFVPSVARAAGQRILLADDNSDMREYVRRLLLQAGYEVETAGDGAAALAAARVRPPSLVLTDVMMPALDGFGLLRELRADSALAAVPVILLSARAGEEARIDGLQAGADDYLIKPFSARELLARVESHLKMARLRRESGAALHASEARFRAIVETTPECVKLVARDGTLLHMNSAGLGMVGAAEAGMVLGKNIYDVIAPKDREKFRAFNERICAGEKGMLQFAIVGLGGVRREMETHAAPLRNPDGSIVQLAVSRDVTEREEVHQRLHQRTAQFETLLNQAPLGVYVVDADFRLRDVNPTAGQVFGDIPDLIGRDFDEVIRLLWPKEFADELVRLFRHTMATGESYSSPEASDQRIDRNAKEYYEWRIDRIPVPDGRYGVVAYFREISAQVRARLTITESEERYRSLVSVITDVPWTTDARGAFVTPQPAWEAYTGQTWAEYRDFGWVNAVHPDHREGINDAWQKASVSRTRYVASARFWHAPTKEWRHYEAQAAPLLNADGSVREWTGACTDTENRIRVEQQLKVARDNALAANRAKDEFLATLSHELRTPLNPVLLVASDSAEDPALPERVRSDFKMIADNISLQAKLIDDLLDFNRIIHGKVTLEQQTLDLHQVVRDAIATIHEEIAAKKINLTFALNACAHTVSGDPVRLRQVFWNILKNAVKFTPAGGHIEISSPNVEDVAEVEVRIRDSGIGMEPEELVRIFNPFVQGRHREENRPEGYGGLGLGLAISRMLAESHHGTITAESPGPGHGSTIVVKLPLKTPDAAEADPSGGAATGTRPPHSGQDRRVHRVLFVEDHEPTRVALTRLLQRRGYEVTGANSVKEALQRAGHGTFDVLISDLGLPDGDGCELMMKLRQTRPLLPGIVLSGFGMDADLSRSRDAGFDEHLTKPVSIDSLDRALARLLQRMRIRGAAVEPMTPVAKAD